MGITVVECLYQNEREGLIMGKRNEFSGIDDNKKRSGMVVFVIAVLAVCISGVLCVRKLQMEQKYICLDGRSVHHQA